MNECRFKNGLIVGKFCPLHLGHELVIETAVRSCERVSILSYTKPEFAGCFPPVRERWLLNRFPKTTVLVLDDDRISHLATANKIELFPMLPQNSDPDILHDQFIGWVCLHIFAVRIDAVFSSEFYGDDLAARLTQQFKSDSSVTHILVDQMRSVVPVSGTKIRENPLAFRKYVLPEVFSEFCGASSADGKKSNFE